MIQSDDKVWFDSNRKLTAVCDEVQQDLIVGNSVLLLSHFPAALAKLTRLLKDRNLQPQSFSTYDAARLSAAPPGTIWSGLARAFQMTGAAQIPIPIHHQLKILVLEHHPRRSQDQALLDATAKLSCPVELCFYFSLDDPLLVHFNGDSMQKLFKRLGIDEREFLSHHLVTTSIRTAQEKIESQVMRDLQAESIEDWFKYNLPSVK